MAITIVMLRHTFIHLPGIGPHRERKLWDQGILDWDRFLDAAASGILTKKMCESAVPLVRQSLEAIAAGDPRFFHTHLPTRETWRLYTEFADRACFLDIETTGLSADYDKVTTIGAWRRQTGPFCPGRQPRSVSGLHRAVSAACHVQRQSVRRAIPAGALPPG